MRDSGHPVVEFFRRVQLHFLAVFLAMGALRQGLTQILGGCAMGFFSKKTLVRTSEFCIDHYNQNFYPPNVQNVDPASILALAVSNKISEVDPNFAALESTEVQRQLILVRFEVFALAWMHRFGFGHAAEQSACTKDYLENRGDGEVWDALADYNQGIAESACFGRSSDNAAGRAFISMTNRIRADFFDEWHSKGFDSVVCARAANRAGTELAWSSGTTAQFLAVEFANRLRYDWSNAGRQRLEFVIRGFYDGALLAFKNVKIS